MSQLPEDPEEKLVGVGGRDPREYASLAFGQRGVELVVERITAKAKELLEGR
jgi:hypothetical protein